MHDDGFNIYIEPEARKKIRQLKKAKQTFQRLRAKRKSKKK